MNVFALVGIEIGVEVRGDGVAPHVIVAVAQRPGHPLRCAETALPGIVGERDRTENHRQRARRGNRSRYLVGSDIRTEQVELILGELETTGSCHVGGVDQHKGAAVLANRSVQIGKGFAFEQDLVEVFGGDVRASVIRRRHIEQVGRREERCGHLVLHVALEKTQFEVLEDAVAKQAVVRRRVAAAGNRRNGFDQIEHAALLAVDHDLGARKLFENAVGERRGARSAA